MVKHKSQIKRIFQIAGQLLLLAVLFMAVGFLLPIRIAPGLADVLSITTPYEAARETMSVRLENRNVTSGDTFQVGVSDPASAVRITSLSYSCDFSKITLAYVQGSDARRIPCDTALTLPAASMHTVMVLTDNPAVTYLPVELTLENKKRVGSISVVVAISSQDIDKKSTLSNDSTATLQSFPAQ
jgi:ammonia channel protein AmtB